MNSLKSQILAWCVGVMRERRKMDPFKLIFPPSLARRLIGRRNECNVFLLAREKEKANNHLALFRWLAHTKRFHKVVRKEREKKVLWLIFRRSFIMGRERFEFEAHASERGLCVEFKLKRKCEPKNFVPFFLQTILGLPLGDPDKVRDNSIGKGNIPTFFSKKYTWRIYYVQWQSSLIAFSFLE